MNEKLKALIVDDEPRARSILQNMLAENCPQVAVLDAVGNVPEAIKAIHTLQPDLVFLDIEMPGYSGFQLLEMIPDPMFQVVFTTAYSEYALKAFEVSAIDYLLKPIRIQKLTEAVQKAQRMLGSHNTAQRISTLQSNLSADVWQRLALPVSDGFVFIRFNEIEALEGEGSYTRIYKTDGSQMLVTRLLRDLENQLSGTGNFLRCHRSHVVNMQYATKWQKSDGGSIILQSGRQVPVNKESRDLLSRLMG
jgi:two-component system, LytTR family, response regulator